MKHFHASSEMYINFFETILLKRGELILSENSNHTIKLMTILIML